MIRRTFRKSVRARAVRDPLFRVSLLEAGLDALLAGDLPGFREGIRSYVNATLGFARLADRTGIPEKSLMRMLGPAGNPRAAHLATIIGAISQHEGVEITARITDPE
ncbi:MAG: transcriptional regulator [Acidobacteria bacterium]|nr:transcriptional regulator [Acidobacteriota bacterium]MYB31298.1 transcriptional regulator [Acidobacteriota bacterium]MYH20798.1 transcriptional regulator [Acidobacteriota bacterium]MYK79095.1 transcriptional regulator [Acidobacteriota bacterium]